MRLARLLRPASRIAAQLGWAVLRALSAAGNAHYLSSHLTEWSEDTSEAFPFGLRPGRPSGAPRSANNVTSGPPPRHPERLQPGLPPTEQERSLWAQFGPQIGGRPW